MRYEVIFRGKLVAGLDEPTVQANVARLFKIDPTRAAALFSGKRVVLKRNLDRGTAEKYREALRRAGAVVAIVSARTENEAPRPSSQAAAERRPAPAPGQSSEPALAEPGITLVEQQRSPAPQIDTSRLSMAEPGAVVDETPRVPTRQIDTSHLHADSISEPLDDSERPAPPLLSLEELELADDAGGLDESRQVPRPDIDTSRLSASAIDAPIDDQERPARPRIDISGLELES